MEASLLLIDFGPVSKGDAAEEAPTGETPTGE
jgi:hypothetical protein